MLFAFVLKRLGGAVLVFLLVSVLAFLLVWLIPGDAVAVLLDAAASPEETARLRAALGLDRTPLEQMLAWYGGLARGHLGHSLLLNRSVAEALLERMPITLSLAALALAIAILLGTTAGVGAALAHGGWLDQILMGAALFGLSVPDFWLGLLFIIVFALGFGWFPTGGFVPISESLTGWARSMALPGLALGLTQMGFIARMARSAMLDVLGQDFVRTAEAKGLSRSRIILAHALPNALVPIVTVIGIVTGALLGGSVVIEQVFSIPGVGRLVVGAILARDFPVIQGGLLFLAGVYLLVNLIVDLLYAVIDPRVRLA